MDRRHGRTAGIVMHPVHDNQQGHKETDILLMVSTRAVKSMTSKETPSCGALTKEGY